MKNKTTIYREAGVKVRIEHPSSTQELAALFPGTAYTDRGHHDFDSFPLGSVPRKDNK